MPQRRPAKAFRECAAAPEAHIPTRTAFPEATWRSAEDAVHMPFGTRIRISIHSSPGASPCSGL
jgi:hypothetical protein